jgi:hypothetical protein
LPSKPPFLIEGATYFDTFRSGDEATFYFYYTTAVTDLCEKVLAGMSSSGWEAISVNCAQPAIWGLQKNLELKVSHDAGDKVIAVRVYR